MSKGRQVREKKKLLIVGDAVAHTGFSSVVHNLADNLLNEYQIAIIGVNYYGDPHPYKYPVYPANLGGDVYGIGRFEQLLTPLQPDIVLVVNDPWIAKEYLSKVKDVKPKMVCYTPIDGKNIKKEFVEPLNGYNFVVAYNQFGLDELRKSGLTVNADHVPHGVDTTCFYPIKKSEARAKLSLTDDLFIVGCSNRNQPRKRLDLMVEYFAEFAKDKPENVKLYYHGGLRDAGWDIVQLMQYYGIEDRFITTSPYITANQGVPKEVLKFVYSSWDVQISTSDGEGHAMTTHEGMACAVPQIVPDWSALSEWPRGGVEYVQCSSTYVRTGGLNTIGGIPDKKEFVDKLNLYYYDKDLRKSMSRAAFNTATKDIFKWENVAARFSNIFKTVLNNDNS